MKFTAHVATPKVGSETTVDFDIDDEDLEGLDEEARDKMIDECAMEALVRSMCFEIWTTQE